MAGAGEEVIPAYAPRPASGGTTVGIPITAALDRHRGGGHPPTPATPPCIRVRTRRFESVALRTVDQARKTERVEVVIGQPH